MSGAPINTLKRRLIAGDRLDGLWLSSGDPLLAEIAAGAGFDWLLIDAEHGLSDLRSVALQLAVAGDTPVLVRPRDQDAAGIKQLLDVGVQSLLVPMVDSADQARALVAATRYPPHGMRGVGAGVARASRFGALTGYAQAADDEICLMVQIESRKAMAAIDEIAAVDGVDALFIGPADLGADMGHRDGSAVPAVAQAVLGGLARIREAGKPAGVFATDPSFAADCRAAGAGFVAVGADLAILAGALRTLARATKTG